MLELLAPAGHWEAMTAAVQNGADAVYLGCGDWNARRGARNFSPEELPQAVRYCHLRGAKVYLTLNTLLADRELPEAEKMLRLASLWGVDAVIVQDWGAAALAREVVPDLPLHGSTQMTIHSLAGAAAAAELGMRCVVLGRELDRENVRHICRLSPVPIEVFGHGALCMCWSGQCAMSAMIGERSGNRGLCAQPCRLPYSLDGGKTGRPLSLKDVSLAWHIPELTEMGVSVLKLEGRMKRPEYVAVVTGIYARLIRENRAPTGEEERQLAEAFSRDGFTDGYWQGSIGRHMFGMRRENAPEPVELFRAAKAGYERENTRRVPVALSAAIRADCPAELQAADRDGHTVRVEGPVPETARTRALTSEELKSRLAKTGGTVFCVDYTDIIVEDGLSLPASAVNGLRREALEALEQLRTAPPERREREAAPPETGAEGPREFSYTVSLSQSCQLTESLMALRPSVVYVPVERIGDFHLSPHVERGGVFCAALPRICKDSELPALRAMLDEARKKGCTAVAVQNIGQLELARGSGLAIRGDFGLNVFNSRALQELKSWGLSSATVSFELRHQQIRDLVKPLPCEAIVYGRLPLMITENCLVSNALSCKSRDLRGACRSGHHLRDRRGERFPVLSVFGCRSEIQNSKTLFLAGHTEYRQCGLTYGRLRFTTESPEQCAAVFRRYLGEPGETPEDFTRGLFYRGVD